MNTPDHTPDRHLAAVPDLPVETREMAIDRERTEEHARLDADLRDMRDIRLAAPVAETSGIKNRLSAISAGAKHAISEWAHSPAAGIVEARDRHLHIPR